MLTPAQLTTLKAAIRVVALVLFSCLSASAQSLTPAQMTALKANVVGTGDTNAKYQAGDLQGLADLYNANASPTFTAWKTNVQLVSVGDNIVSTELASLSTLNATRLQTIALYSPNGVNPSMTDRRAFFDDIFSGAGGVNTRAKLLILWKRLSTRFEKVFATGTGSDASPASIVIEGPVSYTVFQCAPPSTTFCTP